MSCSISLDYYNNEDNNNNPNHPESPESIINNDARPFLLDAKTDNNNAKKFQTFHGGINPLQSLPSCLKFIYLLSRLVYLRRLRYIKFYMGLAGSLLILFLIFHKNPFPTNQQETDAQKKFVNQLIGNQQPNLTKLEQYDDLNKNQVDTNVQATIRKSNKDILKNLDTIQINQVSRLSMDNNYDRQDSRYFSDLRKTSRGLARPRPMLDYARYAKNATFKLDMRDFLRMKPNVMQMKIREAMRHSWNSYRQYAWGYDMLKPRAKLPDHWFDLGLTIVDGADTLIMMGLQNEANQALDWIENDLKFDSQNANSNCFELTIRILAGLLTSYHLSGRDKIKDQATKMGDILLHCYDTESKTVPYSDIDLSNNHAHPPTWNPHSSLSEVASIQLEFRHLSQITKNPSYEDTTFQTSALLHNLTSSRSMKLLPMYINPSTSRLEDSTITLGARADSYYEYLLKQYMQTNIKWLEDDYLDSVDAMGAYLFRHTNGVKNFTYVAEMEFTTDKESVRYTNKMDHLVCFLPGTLALGYYHFSPLASELRLKYYLETPKEKLNSRYDTHLKMAQDLARTCYHMYSEMGTGLSPEIANFVDSQDSENPLTSSQPELQVSPQSAHNILRPEFIESLFYLYHITGLNLYRTQGEQVFDSFEKYCRISSGYTPISDVRQKPNNEADIAAQLHNNAPDRMESFWLSETLKYFYLLFSDDRHVIGTLLNNYVFNTEGHILPIM